LPTLPEGESSELAEDLSSVSVHRAMDELFDEWDAERGAPSADVTACAERELDRVCAEQAAVVLPTEG